MLLARTVLMQNLMMEDLVLFKMDLTFKEIKMVLNGVLLKEIPRALETGLLDLRTHSHVTKITHNKKGLVDGVIYRDVDGNEQRQAAQLIIVSGNSIESPRLLLLSESSMFPDGLANSSGEVGKNYMRHLTGSMYARFDKPVKMYRGETMAGFCADEVKHNPKEDLLEDTTWKLLL